MVRFFFTVILCSNLLFSTQTIGFHSDDKLHVFDAIEYNNSFIFCGSANTSNGREGLLIKTNSELKIVDEAKYLVPSGARFRSLTVLYDMIFVFAEMGSSNNDLAVFCFDENLDVIWSKSLNISSITAFAGKIESHAGYLYLAGGSGAGSFITKLDINGNIIWTKQSNIQGSFFKEMSFDSDNIYACGSSDFNSPQKPLITKFNLDGDVEFGKILTMNSATSLFDIKVNDSHIYTAGYMNWQSSTLVSLIQLSQDGELLKNAAYNVGESYPNFPLTSRGMGISKGNSGLSIYGFFKPNDSFNNFNLSLNNDLEITGFDQISSGLDDGLRAAFKINTSVLFTGSYQEGIYSILATPTFKNCIETPEVEPFIENDNDPIMNDLQFIDRSFSFSELTISKGDINIDVVDSCPQEETGCNLIFEYPNFAEITKLTFLDDALIFEDNARLTNNIPFETGALWHTDPVPVTNKFEMDFSFKISNGDQGTTSEGSLPGADGIAIVFQSRSPQNIGRSAGHIGYGNINNSIAIEFDMFRNPEFNDPNGNHIAVQRVPFRNNSPVHNDENTILMFEDPMTILSDGSTRYYCKLTYENETLSLYLNDQDVFDDPVFVLEDFKFDDHIELLPGNKLFVGFTSATGNAYQTHEIFNWSLCALNPVSVNEKDVRSNSDFEIYPNPAKDQITIRTNEIIQNVKAIDLLGNEFELSLNSNSSPHFNLRHLNSGFYYLEIRTNNNINKVGPIYVLH